MLRLVLGGARCRHTLSACLMAESLVGRHPVVISLSGADRPRAGCSDAGNLGLRVSNVWSGRRHIGGS